MNLNDWMEQFPTKKDVLIDSNVIIDATRDTTGDTDKAHRARQAQDFLRALVRARFRCYIAEIAIAELYCGVRDGDERSKLEALLKHTLKPLPLDKDGHIEAGLLFRKYWPNPKVDLPDMMMAVTAQNFKDPVTQAPKPLVMVTCNRKHYPMFDETKGEMIVPY